MVIVTPNEVGVLADVCRVVREAGCSISHICCSTLDSEARFMLNIEDAQAARTALQKEEYGISEAPVVELTLDPVRGALEKTARRLADQGVDIEFLYGTTSNGKQVKLILSTNDNPKAVELINA